VFGEPIHRQRTLERNRFALEAELALPVARELWERSKPMGLWLMVAKVRPALAG
jgi:hypothetical protein